MKRSLPHRIASLNATRLYFQPMEPAPRIWFGPSRPPIDAWDRRGGGLGGTLRIEDWMSRVNRVTTRASDHSGGSS